MRKYLFVLVLVILFLNGCTHGENDLTHDTDALSSDRAVLVDTAGAERYYCSENRFDLSFLSIPADHYLMMDTAYLHPYVHVFGDEIHFLYNNPETKQDETWIYDRTGAHIKTVVHPAPVQASLSYLLPNGSFLLFSPSLEDGMTVVRLSDETGTIQSEVSLENADNIDCAVQVLEDGSFAVQVGGWFYHLDSDLTVLASDSIGGWVQRFHAVPGSPVVVTLFDFATQGGIHHVYDTEKGKLVHDASLSGVSGIDRSHSILYGPGYDRYYHDGDGVWGYDAASDTAVLLMAHGDAFLSAENTDVIHVFDEETYLAWVTDPFIEKRDLAILKKAPSDSGKLEIRVGLIGGFADVVSNSAALFNRTNAEYHVTVHNYSEDQTDLTRGEEIQAYREDVLSGNAPDVMIVRDAFAKEIRDISRKQGYLDLSPYFKDQLLPCVQSAFETADAGLYAIPLRISVDTLVTAAPDADGSALTLERLMEEAESLAEGDALFSMKSYQERMLLECAVEAFIDDDAGTCSFDSALFGEFLAFYAALSSVNDTDLGYFAPSGIGGVGITSEKLTENLTSGRLRYLCLPLDGMASMAAALRELDGIDISFCGYPSDGTSIGYLSSMNMDLMISASSPVQRGSMEYLRFLLSDLIQNSAALEHTGLPPTVQAMEQELGKTQHLFVNEDTYHTSSVASNGAETVILSRAYERSFAPDDPKLETYMSGRNVWGEPYYTCYVFVPDVTEQLRTLFFNTPMQTYAETTVMEILSEELDSYLGGVRTLEETQKIIQSRVSIYLAERQ